MAEKITTLSHLKQLALRGKADSEAQIAELAKLVIDILENMRHFGITVTLPAANWSGGVQTVRHESLLADSSYWYLIYSDARVKADDITTNGQVTFRCEAVPETDLNVNIIRLEIAS